MGLFSFLRGHDINAGVAEYQATDGAVLLDVRTTDEYRQGHIEDSVNLPLDQIAAIGNIVKNKKMPLYVHCLSGARSGQAVSHLRQMGYTNATNIGGISGYRGKVVR